MKKLFFDKQEKLRGARPFICCICF